MGRYTNATRVDRRGYDTTRPHRMPIPIPDATRPTPEAREDSVMRNRGSMSRLALVGLVGVLLAGMAIGLYFARKARVAAQTRQELVDGRAAIEQRDWLTAATHLARYLRRVPNDWPTRQQFADVQLKLRPIGPLNIGLAIDSYRLVLRAANADAEVAKTVDSGHVARQLARLYRTVGDGGELQFLANRRLEIRPDDVEAESWRCLALLMLGEQRAALDALAALAERSRAISEWPPGLEEAQLSYARAVFDARDADWRGKVDQALSAVFERQPNHPGALLVLAECEWRAMAALPVDQRAVRRPAVRAALDKISADASGGEIPPTVRIAVASRWMDLGDHERARTELRAAAAATDEQITAEVINPNDFFAALRIEQARWALEKRDARLAREVLDALSDLTMEIHQVSVGPSEVRLLILLGETIEARARFGELVNKVRLMRDPVLDPVTMTVLEAEVLLAEWRSHEAIVLLEPLLEIDPTGVQPMARNIRGLLATAYESIGQRDRALPLLTGMVEGQRGEIIAQRDLIAELIRQGAPDLALERALEAEKLFPDDAALRRLRLRAQLSMVLASGVESFADDDLDRMDSQLEALQTAGDEEALAMRAQLTELRGDAQAAEAMLRGGVTAENASDELTLALARLLTQRRDWDAADQVLAEAIQRRPDSSELRRFQAQVAFGSGQPKKGFDLLRRGVAEVGTPEGRYVLQRQLARMLLGEADAQERTEGFAVLTNLAQERPRDTSVRAALLDTPEIWSDVARRDGLIRELREVEGDAGVEWRFQEARRMLDGPDWRTHEAEARAHLRRCITARPRWVEPGLLLGQLEESRGNLAAAEDLYRRYATGGPLGPAVVSRLMNLLLRQGRVEEATAALETARRRLSDDVLSEIGVAALLMMGEGERAVRRLARSQRAEEADEFATFALAAAQFGRDVNTVLGWLRAARAEMPDALPLLTAEVTLLNESQRESEASALLDNWVARRGADALSLTTRARYRETRGELEMAEADFQRMYETLPPSEGAVALADFHWRQQRPARAIETLRAGLSVDAASVPLQRALLRALIATHGLGARGEIEERLAALEQAAPNEALSLRAAWTTLTRPEASEDAQRLLERMIAGQPDDPDAYVQMVNILLRKGDFAGAREWATRGAQRLPENPDVLTSLALAAAAGGDPRTARGAILQALARMPNDRRALAVAADVLVQAGDVDGLERIGPSLARLDVEPTENLRIARVVLHVLSGDIDAAIEQSSPELIVPTAALLGSPDAGNRMSAAVTLLEAWLERRPGDVAARMALASLWYVQGDSDRAMAGYGDVIEHDPEHVEALNNLAYLLAERNLTGDAERAVQLSEAALRRAPDNATILDTRGFVLATAGRADEAIEAYQAALARPASGPGEILQRGRTLLALSRVPNGLEAARAHRALAEQALALDGRESGLSDDERAALRSLLGDS